MSRQEKEEQNNRQFLDEFLELYRQLSPWGRFQIDLYLKWLTFRHQLGKISWDWLMIQWKIDQAIGTSLHEWDSHLDENGSRVNSPSTISQR